MKAAAVIVIAVLTGMAAPGPPSSSASASVPATAGSVASPPPPPPTVQSFHDVGVNGPTRWAVTIDRRGDQVCLSLATSGFTSISYVHVYSADTFLFAAPTPGTCTSSVPTGLLDQLTAAPAVARINLVGSPAGSFLWFPSWCDGGFPDVAVGSTFCLPIDHLADRGVITGYADGLFRPGRTVNRQELVTFLWRLVGQPAVAGPPPFSDVPPESPFAPAIAWAATDPPGPAGPIVSGFGDNTFGPTLAVTRQTLAATAFRLAGSPSSTSGFPVDFADVPPSHPFFIAIRWARAEGILGGYPGNLFQPTTTATRQTSAAAVHQLNAWGTVHAAFPTQIG
jgi:hypothetical protein